MAQVVMVFGEAMNYKEEQMAFQIEKRIAFS